MLLYGIAGLPGVDGMVGFNGTDGIPGLPGAHGKRGKRGQLLYYIQGRTWKMAHSAHEWMQSIKDSLQGNVLFSNTACMSFIFKKERILYFSHTAGFRDIMWKFIQKTDADWFTALWQ